MRGDRDILWKWVIIGDSGVGKTSILSRLCNDEFNNTFISTIGIDFKIKKMEIGGKNVTVQIWDTAGQERFGTITKSCYRGSVGVILVYDTNSRTSFEDVNKWLNDIKLHTGEDVAKILLGNKCDTLSTRAVSVAEGEEVANYNGIPFIETSAKTGKNIEKAFTTLAEQILGESITRNNNNNNENNGEGSNSNGGAGASSASSKNSNFSYSYSFTSDSTKANVSSTNPPSTKAKTNAALELDDPTGFRNHRNSLSGIIRMPTSSPDPTKQPQQLSDQSFQLTEQNLSSSNLNLSAKKSRCC